MPQYQEPPSENNIIYIQLESQKAKSEGDCPEHLGVTVPVFRQRGPRKFGHRREDVHIACWLIDLQPSLDHPWPSEDAWNPDASFPVVGFSP